MRKNWGSEKVREGREGGGRGTYDLNPEIPETDPIWDFRRYELGFTVYAEADQVFRFEC
jgi:hypothetical protein